jgi:type IV secretory pathway VirJ component
VGIDLRSLRRGLEESEGCTYPAGDFEELARNVQLHLKLPSYKRPLLVGYQSGAALVYAALASAPAESFAGGISLGLCPAFALGIPLCELRGLKTKPAARQTYELEPYRQLKVPWVVLQGGNDRVCSADTARTFTGATRSGRFVSVPRAGHRFSAATWATLLDEVFRSLTTTSRATETPRSPIPDTSDLSLIEVPATGPSARDLMAVLISGDGGWAELDKSVAAGLAAAGVPTIGWSSLRYFWAPKTPEQAAADLARVVSRYASAWQKPRVILVGYSFGAEVLPFLINRLPPPIRNRIADVVLLGPGLTASFEFHVAEWFGGSKPTAYRTVPEIERLTTRAICVQGAGETDSACPLLHAPNVTAVTIGDGHHFGGEYGPIVDVILRRQTR